MQHWLCRLPHPGHEFALHVGGALASGLGVAHEPLLHTCPEPEQSVHCPPPSPQAVASLPPTQSPLALQQPLGHDEGEHIGFESALRPESLIGVSTSSPASGVGAISSLMDESTAPSSSGVDDSSLPGPPSAGGTIAASPSRPEP